jgi:hypothetical protein
MEKCKVCQSYRDHTSLDETKTHMMVGRCRRHAPKSEFGYPVVFPDDEACGDFKLDSDKV